MHAGQTQSISHLKILRCIFDSKDGIGTKELNEQTGISYRTIQRTIRKLESFDFIVRRNKGGNAYLFFAKHNLER